MSEQYGVYPGMPQAGNALLAQGLPLSTPPPGMMGGTGNTMLPGQFGNARVGPGPVGTALAAPPGAGAGAGAGAGGSGLTWGDALAALNLVRRPPTPPPGPVVAGNPTSRPAPLAQPMPLAAPGGLGQFLR